MEGQRPFVCVVDDDKSVLTALGRLLRAVEFEVSTFETGAGFLEAISARRPDYVVLDVHMPDMDGFEVREEIHAIDPAIPIGFITAHDGEAIHRRIVEDDHSILFRKPFGGDRLINAIVDAVTANRLARSNNESEAVSPPHHNKEET